MASKEDYVSPPPSNTPHSSCLECSESGACCIKAWQGCHALQLHGKGRLVLHKSIATLLGLANKAEICGPEFGPAKSAQVCGISVSNAVSIVSE